MKSYVKPKVDVVELRFNERIASDPAVCGSIPPAGSTSEYEGIDIPGFPVCADLDNGPS